MKCFVGIPDDWSAPGEQAGDSMEEGEFTTCSAAMATSVSRLRMVAHRDTTVLLMGESGTGKELAARFLHDRHPQRRRGPFVCVHCGAIPESLLESELFGHVRGAFTGAERDRCGRFEQADGGTLFLDEISTMKPEAQIRLLRVLQDRQVARIGATDSRPVDVRVVVATNQPLKTLVAEGRFRLDLYYRISAFPVVLPPLKDRRGDIGELAERLARRVSARLGLESPKVLSPAALRALVAHDWPGNVRELENAIEHACIVSGDRAQLCASCSLNSRCFRVLAILPDDLPAEVADLPPREGPGLGSVALTGEGISLRAVVGNLERELILQSLRLADGNKARAAELLDLTRTTFLEKLRRLEEEEVEGLRPAAQRCWSSAGLPEDAAP